MKLRYLACFVLLANSTAHAGELTDRLALEDSTVYISDLEFDYDSNTRLLWHGVEGRLWLATINPADGTITPGDGRGKLLDLDAAPPQMFGNGAEWVYGGGEVYILYNNKNKDVVALREEAGQWVRLDLGDMSNRALPMGTPPGSSVARLSFYDAAPGTPRKLVSQDLLGGGAALILPEARNSHWMDTDHFVTAVPVDRVMQSTIVDFTTGAKTVVTTGAGHKTFSRVMYAPDLHTDVLFCTAGLRVLQLWVPSGTGWRLMKSIVSPNGARRIVRDPEPFVYEGRSYVAFVCSEASGFEVGNASDIWLTPVSPARETAFIKRINRENTADRFLVDPENYIAQDDAYIFYGELSYKDGYPNGWYTTRKVPTGLVDIVSRQRQAASSGGVPAIDGRLSAWPLPFRGGNLNVAFPTIHDGSAVHTDVALYDVTGRRIRMLAQGTFHASPQQVQWDGRDDGGSPVPSGVYFLRASSALDTRTMKVVVVR